MAAPLALLAPLLQFGSEILNRVIPDKTEQAKAQMQLIQLAQTQEFQKWADAAGIVHAEAQSSNWLTSAWRPLTMLTFVALIVARMFGLTADAVSENEYMLLWDLVKLGLGGYVIGRSVEKIAPGILDAVRSKS